MDSLFSNIQQSLQQSGQKSLIQNQQINQDKINELLEQASSTLLCGPTCQKVKKTEELKQKYLDAETNVKTAPIELERSRKNFYVFSEGNAYYENMLEKELNERVEKIASLLSNNFNDELTSASTMNQYLNTALINSSYVEELLEYYLEQNKNLTVKLMSHQGDILTNDRKTYYETEELDRLKKWYNVWWYIYYILIVSFIVSCILLPSHLSNVKKIVISILLIFYPYYIDFILRKIYMFFASIYKRLPKNVYNDL
jgi:uncharacterized membrane protein (DUF485 family)